MSKKGVFVIAFITIIFMIFLYRIYDLAYIKKEEYQNLAESIKEVYVTGASAPRGRILDINGNVLVDNIGTNTIFYHKPSGITLKEELDIAERLTKLTNFTYEYSKSKLKEFYKIKYEEEVNKLITEEEYKL